MLCDTCSHHCLVERLPLTRDTCELRSEGRLEILSTCQPSHCNEVFYLIFNNITLSEQTMQNTAKQNYRGSVALYNTQPGNAVGLFYNTPNPTQSSHIKINMLTISRY